ncbi:GL12225 [Drosophila persimilis]|uniref:GL12225 n=1 Tax=Drosophila persimilis TaxID=7234 RepID=B4H3C0_DROPE|nr:GL12225 [Drosophila persimilis]
MHWLILLLFLLPLSISIRARESSSPIPIPIPIRRQLELDREFEVEVEEEEEEPLRTSVLQSSLLLQFCLQYRHIPRLTYFTCRNPETSSGNEEELRAAFAAKNAQLIKSLYRSQLFVRIVRLDVLQQTGGGSASSSNDPRRGGRVQGRPGPGPGPGAGPGFGFGFGFAQSQSQAQSNAEWLDSVLSVDALRQIVAVDLACGAQSRRLLDLASAKRLYSDKFHWLLIEDFALFNRLEGGADEHLQLQAKQLQRTKDEEDLRLPTIEDFMEGLNLYMNTELILAKRLSEAANYTLYDVWNPGLNYGGRVSRTEIGSFTPSEGVRLQTWYRRTSTVRRRMNMQHARVRCMVVVTNKNMTGTLMYYLTHTVSGHIDTMNRFNFNLLMAVRDMFNWTFVLSRTTSWGYVKNGRFDGMIGALIRNETDIGGAPIFYWLERHKWIDVAGRSWSSRPCFIFRHPRNTQKDRIVFLQPFTNDVWVLIMVCGVVTVCILWLLTTIEWKLVPHDGAAALPFMWMWRLPIRSLAETFSEQDICDLTEVSMFPPQKTVCIMQKNSPMRKVISYGLRRVTETGILTYHFNVWHSRKPPCVKKIETSDLHVDMDTVSSALLILLFSYGITLMILGTEILYSKWHRRIIIKFS